MREGIFEESQAVGAQRALGGPPLGDVDGHDPQGHSAKQRWPDRQAGTPPAFKAEKRALNRGASQAHRRERPICPPEQKVARKRAAQLLRGPGAGVPGFPGDQPEPPAPLSPPPAAPPGALAGSTSAPRGRQGGEAQSAGTKRHESQRMFESRKKKKKKGNPQ